MSSGSTNRSFSLLTLSRFSLPVVIIIVLVIVAGPA